MIPVCEQPEPIDFEVKVKNPGMVFLAQTPKPKKWDGKDYWKNCLWDLWNAYNGVCAYACHWIPQDTGVASVEHFIPKNVAPHLAYDWKNYRLVCSRLNGRKSNYQDVLDPFTVKHDWFILVFPAMLVKANPTLPDELKQKVNATIDRLKLNDDDTNVQARLQWLLDYCRGYISHEHLKERAPFIAYELERQNLLSRICSMLKYPKRKQ